MVPTITGALGTAQKCNEKGVILNIQNKAINENAVRNVGYFRRSVILHKLSDAFW